jgi:hypothetical protein
MRWWQEFIILIIQLTVVSLVSLFIFGAHKDFVFLDAVLTILLIDLVDRRANRK